MGKIARVFSTLREERENILELKSVLGVQNLPAGTLQLGAEGIKRAIQSFEEAKLADLENERLPPVLQGQKAPAPAAPIFGKTTAAPEHPNTSAHVPSIATEDDKRSRNPLKLGKK